MFIRKIKEGKINQSTAVITLIIISLFVALLINQGIIKFPLSISTLSVTKPPNSTLVKIIQLNRSSAESFTCEYDGCIVEGGMKVLKNSGGTPKKIVYFRMDREIIFLSSWVAWDINDDDVMECFSVKSNPNPSCNLPKSKSVTVPYTMSSGVISPSTDIYYYNSNSNPSVWDITNTDPNNYCTSTQSRRLKGSGCDLDSNENPSYPVELTKNIGTLPDYKADWNFCPIKNNAEDTYFENCKGTSATYSSESSKDDYVYTEKVLLNNKDSIRFDPKYPDSSKVEDKTLTIELYDKSCYNKIQLYDGSACDPFETNYVLCKPAENICPPSPVSYYDYILVDSNSQVVYCNGGDYGYSNVRNQGYICHLGPNNNWNTCKTPLKDYKRYSTCIVDAQTLSSGVKCGAYGSDIFNTTDPRKCLLKTTGQPGSGVGSLGCLNSCTKGDRRTSTSGLRHQYDECGGSLSCYDWSTNLNCPNGLVYEDLKNKCVFPSENHCIEESQTECIGTKSIRNCAYASLLGLSNETITDYQWKAPVNCSGDYVCGTQQTGDKYPSCGCNTVNICSLGKIKCIDASNYQSCSSGSYPYSCLDYRGSTKAPDGRYCVVNNVYDSVTDLPIKAGCRWDDIRGGNPTCTAVQQCLTTDPNYPDGTCINAGCAYDTAGSECPPQTDANLEKVEICDRTPSSSTYNSCIPNPTVNLASSSDFGNTRCKLNANQVQKVTKYTSSRNTYIYRWEKAQDCTGDYFCVSNNNKAICDICSKLTDSRGNLFEEKSGNTCVLKVDEFTASADLVGQTKCSGDNSNTVYYVKTYTDTTINPNRNFYTWEVKTDEVNSVNGVCSDGFFCSYNDNTKLAKCDTSFNYIGVIGKSDFAVGEYIGGFTVIVKSTVPNYLSNSVSLFFFDEKNVPIGQLLRLSLVKNPSTSDGERLITQEETKIKLDRPGTIKVTAISGDIATSPYKISKNLTIKKTLELRFGNCPLSSFINRPYTCTWKAIEKCGLTNCQEVTGADYQKSITPEVPTSGSSLKSITITPDKMGDISIKVTATATGYLSDEKEFKTNIQDTVYSIDLYLDNKLSSSYITGITQGTHELKLKITESGIIADVQRVDFTIKTPTGNKDGTPNFDNLNFIQNGDYWKTNYDFKDAGRTYTIGDTGEIGAKDDVLLKDYTNQAKVPSVAFSVSTSQSKTEDIKGELSMAVIYIAVGVFVFIVFVILLAIMYKRRLKSATGISVANQTI